MTLKKNLDGLNYREAQKRNSEKFNSLTMTEKKAIRKQGYKNLGWDNIIISWNILSNFISQKLPTKLADFAIKKAEKSYQDAKKKGDIIEILESGQSVIEAIKMKYQ